nr:hypothetical protein [Massilia violaceinigra]
MLVFDAGARLEAWSANVGTLLLMAPGMGMPLQAVGLPAPIAQMVQECLALCAGDAIPWMLAVHIGGREFDCVAHAHLGRVIVEFELRDVSLDEVGIFALKAHSALDRLKRQTTVTSLLQMATDQVREITGFDRVMGYRFAQDGSGDCPRPSAGGRLADGAAPGQRLARVRARTSRTGPACWRSVSIHLATAGSWPCARSRSPRSAGPANRRKFSGWGLWAGA